ncbi:unnamed protein product [Symbiodinium pilosum]|uniref:Uncharacterized protein n=1 Tax=Symbiodinium pilosum TaxID=2952 RepID=A0A812TQL2_SYMPI|nr:unnamed protein product [Symbiodinium pilosum]
MSMFLQKLQELWEYDDAICCAVEPGQRPGREDDLNASNAQPLCDSSDLAQLGELEPLPQDSPVPPTIEAAEAEATAQHGLDSPDSKEHERQEAEVEDDFAASIRRLQEQVFKLCGGSGKGSIEVSGWVICAGPGLRCNISGLTGVEEEKHMNQIVTVRIARTQERCQQCERFADAVAEAECALGAAELAPTSALVKIQARLRTKTPPSEANRAPRSGAPLKCLVIDFRKKTRTKTPEREVHFVRQLPDHLRGSRGGHPQKRLRTKTPDRDVRWVRSGPRPPSDRQAGLRQETPRPRAGIQEPRVKSAEDGQVVPSALKEHEYWMLGRPKVQDNGDFSAALQDRRPHGNSKRRTTPRLASKSTLKAQELEDHRSVVEPGQECFPRLISPKSEAEAASSNPDRGSDDEMWEMWNLLQPTDEEADETATRDRIITLIKKMLAFRGMRCPSGQRYYARSDVLALFHKLFHKVKKLGGEKVWRGQAVRYVHDLFLELDRESRFGGKLLHQNASFWKGSLLLLLKHLGEPHDEVEKLQRQYYMKHGRRSQKTVCRPAFKDIGHYYAECQPRTKDFEVDPETPSFTARHRRPRLPREAKENQKTKDYPVLFVYLVRPDNSTYPCRTGKSVTVRQCVQEAFEDAPYDPDCYFCLYENEAVPLDTEIGNIPWQGDRKPRLLFAYLRNRARHMLEEARKAAACCGQGGGLAA